MLSVPPIGKILSRYIIRNLFNFKEHILNRWRFQIKRQSLYGFYISVKFIIKINPGLTNVRTFISLQISYSNIVFGKRYFLIIISIWSLTGWFWKFKLVSTINMLWCVTPVFASYAWNYRRFVSVNHLFDIFIQSKCVLIFSIFIAIMGHNGDIFKSFRQYKLFLLFNMFGFFKIKFQFQLIIDAINSSAIYYFFPTRSWWRWNRFFSLSTFLIHVKFLNFLILINWNSLIKPHRILINWR